jgi:hypothetical protein
MAKDTVVYALNELSPTPWKPMEKQMYRSTFSWPSQDGEQSATRLGRFISQESAAATH